MPFLHPKAIYSGTLKTLICLIYQNVCVMTRCILLMQMTNEIKITLREPSRTRGRVLPLTWDHWLMIRLLLLLA